MPDLNFSHQDNIFDPKFAKPLTVIGAGSVGSFIVLAAAKMGIDKITVYDGDSVESHNIPMSIYRPCDLGIKKVRALKEIVRDQTGVEITAIPEMWMGQRLAGTTVACVDTMETRMAISVVALKSPLVDLLIDTRVVGEFISIFAIEPKIREDWEFYCHYLGYSTDQATLMQCGTHGIAPLSMRAASVVSANLISFWKNGTKERHYEELCISLQRV